MPIEHGIALLVNELETTLELLADFHGSAAGPVSSEPLPSLLAQCENLCAEIPARRVLRTVHHFACTGGTLISKSLAALPGAILLSEIDPLSKMMIASLGKKPNFAPTDLILNLRHATRDVPETVLVETFLAGLRAMHKCLTAAGYRLILRDHAHSQFCWNTDPVTRPTLLEILAQEFPLCSVVSVRHPLESYLSLEKNGWRHFSPFTLEEYCRRYIMFLDRYQGIPLIRYEDFVIAPETVLEEICGLLDMPFTPLALDLIEIIRLSGDSGRNESRIAPRPPKTLPVHIADQLSSESYRALCARCDYDLEGAYPTPSGVSTGGTLAAG